MVIFGLPSETIKEKLRAGHITTAVFGLGHVGLPLAIAWLRAGARVIGSDLKRKIVEEINGGKCPITHEPGISENVRKYVANGRLRATTDLVQASHLSDVKVITVPTTLVGEKKFNPTALKKALNAIGKGLNKGDVVIIECSVPPTTTEKIAKTILELESGLKCEENFALAFSPERVYEGHVLQDIEESYPKIVGGVGSKSTETVAALYECIAKKGVLKVSNATAAEASKMFEGIYRDVNIALANELAKFCQGSNIDFMEVRHAANSQPYCHLHVPGCGVGGLCIPYYPYFTLDVAAKVGVSMPLTSLARRINEAMPNYTVKLVLKALNHMDVKPLEAKIAILGLAFRGGVADTRNSPTYHIIELLKERGTNIVVHDPHIKSDKQLKAMNVPLLKTPWEAIFGASVIIIATDHKEFRTVDFAELARNQGKPIAIIDGRNILNLEDIPSNVHYVGIGRRISNH